MAYQSGADFFLERPHTPEAFGLAAEAIKGLLATRMDEPAKDKGEPEVRVADIVQMRCLSGDSVLLLVRAKQESGDIFIYRGEVYHAQYPGKGGEAAFRDMLLWDDGGGAHPDGEAGPYAAADDRGALPGIARRGGKGRAG